MSPPLPIVACDGRFNQALLRFPTDTCSDPCSCRGRPELPDKHSRSLPGDRMSKGEINMRNYEAVVIVDPRLEEAAIQQAVDKLTKVIQARGEMAKIDQWGRRRLAYEINHLKEGHYFVASFKAEADLIEDLDRTMRIGEEYIRHKIVRVP